MTEQQAHSVDPAPASGNVARVSMLVQRVTSIIQTAGSFEVVGSPSSSRYGAMLKMPSWEDHLEGSTLRLTGSFSFLGVNTKDDTDSPPSPDDAFVRVSAKFVVEYELSDGERPSSEDITAFANVNGTLNVHPYWREFVHSSLGRSGMPQFLLPVFNPVKMGLLPSKKTKSDSSSMV